MHSLSRERAGEPSRSREGRFVHLVPQGLRPGRSEVPAEGVEDQYPAMLPQTPPAHSIIQGGIPAPASCSGDPGLLFLFSRGMRRHCTPRPCSRHSLLHLAESSQSQDALRSGMLSDLGCSQHGGHCLRAQAGSQDLSPLISEGMDSQIN